MIKGLEAGTVYFDPEDVTRRYEASIQPMPLNFREGLATTAALIRRRPRPAPTRFQATPKHPSTESFSYLTAAGMVETYTGLIADPSYYSGMPTVSIRRPKGSAPDEVVATHNVSARTMSNLYLGIHHHIGERAARAFVTTILNLDELSPSNVLTQLSRLKYGGWEARDDQAVDRGSMLEAGMRATGGELDRAHLLGTFNIFGGLSRSGVDATQSIKNGLVTFVDEVNPSEQAPYLVRRDGYPVIFPEVVMHVGQTAAYEVNLVITAHDDTIEGIIEGH
jgi:hypothetical protein